MSYRQQRVLVTGASGFIGSHLVETLVAAGARVTAWVHYNGRNDWGNLEGLSRDVLQSCQIIEGDVTDSAFARKAAEGQDVIFHLAALIGIPYSYLAPLSYVRTNVEGTVNLLEAARYTGVRRFVHTSTSEAYGTAQFVPITEVHPLQGQSPYSASKIAADKMAESYYCAFSLPVIVVRPFNTYGPRQSARAVIPTIASQLLAGQHTIRLGSLTPVRDMNYVTDIVAGFLAAGQCDVQCLGETINLGSGVGVTIAHIAEALMRITGQRAAIVEDAQRVRPAQSEVFQLIASNEKAARLLHWQSKVALETGLRHVAEYVAASSGRYKPNRYNV
ncbi:MAG: GDP-mannose 4,6-dehydratase [Deltaproteobacteria bacterium]|nr:GDP-mannose 4,6-dehydratase [Deltaproteobacteria bacterium]